MTKGRIPTLVDVARAAGVSTATVSHVLNGTRPVAPATAARVKNAIAELGYSRNESARTLRTSTSTLVAVLVVDYNPFFTEVVKGIDEAAAGFGWKVVIANTGEDMKRQREALSTMVQHRVSGLIIAPAAGWTAESFGAVLRERAFDLPVVAIDRKVPRLPLPTITAANMQGAEEAVRHLLQHGHERVATIIGHPQLSTSTERLTGYQSAMREAGLAIRPEWIRYGNSSQEGGYRAMHEILRLPDRPTATFITNNLMTLGALRALREAQIAIPEQMALAVFDAEPWVDVVTPPLTAVRQPVVRMGEMAVRLIHEMHRHDSARTSTSSAVELPVELKLGSSCGC